MKRKYNFTKADLQFRKNIEERRGTKLSDKEFFEFIEGQKKWLSEKFVPAIKEWLITDPVGADQFSKMVDRMMEREKDKELYEMLAAVKRLSIAQVEQILQPILETSNYKNLHFSQPELGRGIKVEFIAQEATPDKSAYDSRIDLRKLIDEALRDTNWKLMSDGISYQLGFLQGRLLGIQNEDDLKELVQLRLRRGVFSE